MLGTACLLLCFGWAERAGCCHIVGPRAVIGMLLKKLFNFCKYLKKIIFSTPLEIILKESFQ
jgi:hypothetical protein